MGPDTDTLNKNVKIPLRKQLKGEWVYFCSQFQGKQFQVLTQDLLQLLQYFGFNKTNDNGFRGRPIPWFPNVKDGA